MKTIQKLETHSPSKEILLNHCVYRIFRYLEKNRKYVHVIFL